MSEPLSLSPQEAAVYVGLSVPTIYRLLSAGAITARRSGPRTLIDGKALRTWFASLPAYVSRPMANAPHVTVRRRRRAGRS
jgi:excisionase family DNA binding protein